MEEILIPTIILTGVAIRLLRNRMTKRVAEKINKDIDDSIFTIVFGSCSLGIKEICANYIAARDTKRSDFYIDSVLKCVKDQRGFIERVKEYESRVAIKKVINLCSSIISRERNVLKDEIDKLSDVDLITERVAYFSAMTELDLTNEDIAKDISIGIINDKRLRFMYIYDNPFRQCEYIQSKIMESYKFYSGEIDALKKSKNKDYRAIASRLYGDNSIDREHAESLMSGVSKHIYDWLKKINDERVKSRKP